MTTPELIGKAGDFTCRTYVAKNSDRAEVIRFVQSSKSSSKRKKKLQYIAFRLALTDVKILHKVLPYLEF